MFTLTIYFIVLNLFVEFVLIYRPHPVQILDDCKTEVYGILCVMYSSTCIYT